MSDIAIRVEGLGKKRHKSLRFIARAAYLLPGIRFLTRVVTRFTIGWLPFSLTNKQRLYNFVSPDTIPSRPVSFTTHRHLSRPVRLKLDLRDDLSRMWYYWGYAGYENGTIRLFRKLLESKSCVFDIGANIGYYALLAATWMEGRGEVHAFEPAPAVFPWLSRNIEANGFQCVHLNQAALSDADGEQRLFLPLDSAWTNASLIENFTKQAGCVATKTLRFDTYCAAGSIKRADLIKVDVEGGELMVFRGMGLLLDEWHPDIICEVLPPFERKLDDFFAGKKYRKFLITDDGLQEVANLQAHSRFRDYYLSCDPPAETTFTNTL